jgi:hypothetical protein
MADGGWRMADGGWDRGWIPSCDHFPLPISYAPNGEHDMSRQYNKVEKRRRRERRMKRKAQAVKEKIKGKKKG